jgi:hypothetical protein
MGTINIGEYTFDISGDKPTDKEVQVIKEYIGREQQTKQAETEKATSTQLLQKGDQYEKYEEVPYKIRFAVSAAPNLESKFATLRKFYTDVKQDEFNDNNFVVTDANGKKFVVNKTSTTNLGDVVDLARPIAQIGGSIAGAALATGPTLGAGTLVGAGLGQAAGSEIIEKLGKLAGTEIERTPGEYLTERLGDVAIGSISQAMGPLIIKGAQRLIRGPVSLIEKETAEGGIKTITDMEQRLENFASAGVSPKLTQVTENKLTDAIGGLFSKFPVAAGMLQQQALKQQNQLGTTVGKLAGRLIGKTEGATGEEAGQALQRGILGTPDPKTGLYGADGFMSRFRGQTAVNYGEVDKLLPNNIFIKPELTYDYLKTAVNNINDTAAFKKIIGDPKIEAMLSALQKNMGQLVEKAPGQFESRGTLPYAQFKALRTAIGEKIANYNLNEPTSRTFYKGLYKSLVGDVQAGAKNVSDEAYQALQKADRYHNTNMTLIDDFLEKLSDKVNPDNLVNSISKNAKEGSTQLKALRGALNDKEYDVVVSNIIDTLGKKTTTDVLSKSGDLITTSQRTNYFNTNTFLNNWNKLPDTSKQLLFNSSKTLKGLDKEINNIALVANDIEKANPFGAGLHGESPRYAGQGLLIGAAGGAAAGALTGGVTGGTLGLLAAIPLVGWGGAQAAKLFSNPAFLKWLSNGVKVAGNKGVNGYIENFGKIGGIMANSDPESRTLMQHTLGVIGDATDKILKTEREKQKSKPYTPMPPISQAVTQPQVNMFAANQQAQTPSGQVQTPQGQPSNFTNIPQNQLDKYSTLFGKVV